MKIGRSNPAMSRGFSEVRSDGTTMTVGGTIIKTLVFLAILTVAFAYSWLEIPYSGGIMIAITVAAFVMAMIITFNQKSAQYLGVVYAALEGLFLGSISHFFDRLFPGIVLPAVVLTFVCVIVTIAIYGRNPTVADKTRKIFMIGIITILVAEVISLVLSFVGFNLGIFSNGPIGIIFSLAVVALATLSLIQDYDFIGRASRSGAPKYMEWYGAFGLMVTLVWLYVEILNLLAQISSNRN